MGKIPWHLRKYTFNIGNTPHNKGKKVRSKRLSSNIGKFVRLTKDKYDLVTKPVDKTAIQSNYVSANAARLLRPKPAKKTEVEKCAQNERKTG